MTIILSGQSNSQVCLVFQEKKISPSKMANYVIQTQAVKRHFSSSKEGGEKVLSDDAL